MGGRLLFLLGEVCIGVGEDTSESPNGNVDMRILAT